MRWPTIDQRYIVAASFNLMANRLPMAPAPAITIFISIPLSYLTIRYSLLQIKQICEELAFLK